MAVLQTRLVSGRGLLKVPQNNDLKKAKILTLFCDLTRPPTPGYLNNKSNPPQGFYGRLTFMRSNYVIATEDIIYPQQVFEFAPENFYQTLYALQCTEAALRLGLANIGSNAPASAIANWRHDSLFFEEVRLVCYADSAISLKLNSLPYDTCVDLTSPPPGRVPPPDSPPTPVPAGTPLNGSNGTPNISPPYTGANDDGNSIPYAGDSSTPPPPPPPPNCSTVNFTLVWKQTGGNQNGQISTWTGSYTTPWKVVKTPSYYKIFYSRCSGGQVIGNLDQSDLPINFSGPPIDGYPAWYEIISETPVPPT